MTGSDFAAALAGVLLGIGTIVAMWWTGSEATTWDDANERRNGDR